MSMKVLYAAVFGIVAFFGLVIFLAYKYDQAKAQRPCVVSELGGGVVTFKCHPKQLPAALGEYAEKHKVQVSDYRYNDFVGGWVAIVH